MKRTRKPTSKTALQTTKNGRSVLDLGRAAHGTRHQWHRPSIPRRARPGHPPRRTHLNRGPRWASHAHASDRGAPGSFFFDRPMVMRMRRCRAPGHCQFEVKGAKALSCHALQWTGGRDSLAACSPVLFLCGSAAVVQLGTCRRSFEDVAVRRVGLGVLPGARQTRATRVAIGHGAERQLTCSRSAHRRC